MRQRAILIVSVGLNAILAAGVIAVLKHHEPASVSSVPEEAQATAVSTNPGKPRVVVRKQFFSWQEVESTDYPIYIKNLRDIGCPEQTIRDIIIADVNALYAKKRLTEIVTSDQQWWRSDPDASLDQAASAKMQALEQERRALLATLLGPDWEQGTMPMVPRPGIRLNGPVLGQLSPETKQAVLDISTRSQQRTSAYLAAQAKAGQSPDPAELARIRQQARNELAQVLTLEQLEEFLLRYSQSASALRRQIRGFEVTPDEFRQMFRAIDPIEEQISSDYAGNSPTTQQQRAVLEKRLEEAIANTLGPDRYEELRMAKDPAYRDAVLAVEEAGASPNVLTNLYAINMAVAQQLDLIRNNPNLTDDQKAAQIKAVQDQQAAARDQLLGLTQPAPPLPPPAPPQYHAFVPGETLEAIANSFGVSPDALRAANPNLDMNRLSKGASIRIPSPPSPAQ